MSTCGAFIAVLAALALVSADFAWMWRLDGK